MGYKKLSWLSVEIPATAPKPHYTLLTAGYRRTPALQIGADVYCDTRLIAEVLEATRSHPSLFPGPERARSKALCECLRPWSEEKFMWPLVRHITGLHADRFPKSFHADRAQLHGKPIPELAQVKASARNNLVQLQPQLNWLEALLSHQHEYILGAQPSLADFCCYIGPWFLDLIGGANAMLDALPLTRAWMARIAVIGHGNHAKLTAEDARHIANENTPQAPLDDDPSYLAPEGIKLGERVSVTPLHEQAPATGTLVGLSEMRIVIRTQAPQTGSVNVHFPRLDYRLRRVAS